MEALKDILNYLRNLRTMGMGKWQSRLFFISIFVVSLGISIALIILATNVDLTQLIELKNNV